MYRRVFEKIAEEDQEFADDPIEIPSFGDSLSSYEEVLFVEYSNFFHEFF